MGKHAKAWTAARVWFDHYSADAFNWNIEVFGSRAKHHA